MQRTISTVTLAALPRLSGTTNGLKFSSKPLFQFPKVLTETHSTQATWCVARFSERKNITAFSF
jgi:hypothetical protein